MGIIDHYDIYFCLINRDKQIELMPKQVIINMKSQYPFGECE